MCVQVRPAPCELTASCRRYLPEQIVEVEHDDGPYLCMVLEVEETPDGECLFVDYLGGAK